MRLRHGGSVSPRAFSLLEMLVVMGIIALLAGLAAPVVMKGLGQGNAINAANRQILDAFNEARLRAMNNRATVYVVFIPPGFYTNMNYTGLSAEDREMVTNLIGGQYTSYALYSKRQVGDQPGSATEKYLTEWRTLPKDTFVATQEFDFFNTNTLANLDASLTNYQNILFPSDGATNSLSLPVVEFNPKGQLASGSDLFISVARGSLFFARDLNGVYLQSNGDPKEVPPFNSTNNLVRVNWLTGRGKIERLQIQ